MLEKSSLAFEANGVTTKATKNGGMPELDENPPIESTKGSANKAAKAAPPKRYKPAAFFIVFASELVISFSSSLSSPAASFSRRSST